MTRPAAPSAALPPGLLIEAPRGISPVLVVSVLGAALLHTFLVLGISFEMPEPDSTPPAESALQVLIFKETGVMTENPAADAALSRLNRVGESPRGDAAVAAPPVPEPEPEPEPHVEPEPEPPPIPEPKPEPEPEPPAPDPPPREAPPEAALEPLAAPRRAPVDAAQILASRNREIQRLTASLEARSAAYAKRQRRRAVSASTREFRYASYLAAWASKVERIGNLNYPEAAKDQHIYGNLILHVAVRRDGSVEQIRVVRSSGYDVLDQAAIQIVELAAPYAPFPPDIAAEVDVLDIIRTWQFERGGRLGWDN